MGLLDEYEIDINDYEPQSYEDPEDGYYPFEIVDMFVREGTENKPDHRWMIIRYGVGDTGKTKDEWFRIPKDPSDPLNEEIKGIGWYRSRLESLGFDRETHSKVTRDDLIGLEGTFKLETRKGFQNIYNVKVGEQESPVPAPKASAPSRPPARPAARTAPATRRPAARPAPVEEPEESEESEYEEQAEEAVTPPPVRRPAARTARQAAREEATEKQAAQAGVRKNPFAK